MEKEDRDRAIRMEQKLDEIKSRGCSEGVKMVTKLHERIDSQNKWTVATVITALVAALSAVISGFKS